MKEYTSTTKSAIHNQVSFPETRSASLRVSANKAVFAFTNGNPHPLQICLPNDARAGQGGFSLLELVIAIVIIGLALPALIYAFGNLTRIQADNEIQFHLAALSEAKMSEITAFRNGNVNWYESIADFQGSESLPESKIRETVVTRFNNWGTANISGFEVQVKTLDTRTNLIVTLKARFTNYQK